MEERVTNYHNAKPIPGENLTYAMGMLHSDELSPDLVSTHREADRTPYPLPVHSHQFLELAYIRSGPEMDYLIGSDTYRVRPGDVLLIPPEVLHGPVLPEDSPGERIRDVVWVSRHFLSRMSQLRPNVWFYASRDYHVFRTAGTRWAGIGELFEKGLAERQNRRFGWESAVVGNTMVLLSQLGRALLDASVLILKEDRAELLFRVMDYMENHLSDKLTLETVAAQFDVSKSTLTQMFRKKLDISFYSYLTKRRLTVAKSLIVRGTPLEQVGKQVGFKEHSAFYRAFKQEFGISPREYKSGCGRGDDSVSPHQ